MPFWELTSKLLALSFDFGTYHDPPGRRFFDDAVEGEQSEDTLLVELPAQPPTHEEWDARGQLNYSIAVRTLIAAARAGHLRRLDPHYFPHAPESEDFGIRNMISPFAVRALLPYWVAVDDWHQRGWINKSWGGAPVALRVRLSHESLWFGSTTPSMPRADRHLTGEEVQTMEYDLQDEGAADVASADLEPAYAYLFWLNQDPELAQQVADAWNAAVDRGAADAEQCRCDQCRSLLQGYSSE